MTLIASLRLADREFLDKRLAGDAVLSHEILQTSGELLERIMVSVGNIVHSVEELSVVHASSLVLL